MELIHLLITIVFTLVSVNAQGNCIIRENLAIVSDEWDSVTVGINILMPSDLTAYIIDYVKSSPISEELTNSRVKIIKKHGETQDRTIRHDMMEMNRKVIYSKRHTDFYTNDDVVIASCKGTPDTENSGKCDILIFRVTTAYLKELSRYSI
jgi:hypothetical protein